MKAALQCVCRRIDQRGVVIPYARITDKTVQLAKRCEDLIHRALIVGVAGDVAFDCQYMFAKALTQTGNFSWRQFQRGDLRTFFDETLDQRGPRRSRRQ